MFDIVECPHCGYDNDMSDGLTDLPSDNKFDQECANCEREFEVEVEFEPHYSSAEIVYEKCEKCGTETRDIPKYIEAANVCRMCYLKAVAEKRKGKVTTND